MEHDQQHMERSNKVVLGAAFQNHEREVLIKEAKEAHRKVFEERADEVV